jgi:autoinducer 2-degrading protein
VGAAGGVLERDAFRFQIAAMTRIAGSCGKTPTPRNPHLAKENDMQIRRFAFLMGLLLFGVGLVQTVWSQAADTRQTKSQRLAVGSNKCNEDKEVKGMIVSAIQFTFASKDADTAEKLLRGIRDASIKEPGVVRFDVARSSDDPNVFVLWEVYRDQAAVDAHKESEPFKRLVLNGIRPLAQQRTAVRAAPIDE